jgi:hypothetical protein
MELDALGIELDKYLLDYLNTFRDGGANKGKDYIVQDSTFRFDAEPSMDATPHIFSDQIIFEWVSGKSPYYHELTKILGGGPVQKNAEEWWGLEYPGYELAQKYWMAVLAITGIHHNSYLENLFDEDAAKTAFESNMQDYLAGDKWMAENSPYLFGYTAKLKQFFFLNPLFGKLISTLVGGSFYSDISGFSSATQAAANGDESWVPYHLDSSLLTTPIPTPGSRGTENEVALLNEGHKAIMRGVGLQSYYDGLVKYYENRVDPYWRQWKEQIQGLLNPPEKALEKFNHWDTQRKITEKRIEWFEKNMEAMKATYENFLLKQEEVLKSTQERSALLSEAEVNFETDIDDSSRSYAVSYTHLTLPTILRV